MKKAVVTLLICSFSGRRYFAVPQGLSDILHMPDRYISTRASSTLPRTSSLSSLLILPRLVVQFSWTWLLPFRMVCRNFILPETANHIFYFGETYSTLSRLPLHSVRFSKQLTIYKRCPTSFLCSSSNRFLFRFYFPICLTNLNISFLT